MGGLAIGRGGVRASQTLGVGLSTLAGGALMGGVGYTHGSGIATGAAAGALLVGALGYGVVRGTMSPVTLCSVLFALFFTMIGPGCDDVGGVAAIPAAIVGAVVGFLFFGPRGAPRPQITTSFKEARPCESFDRYSPS